MDLDTNEVTNQQKNLTADDKICDVISSAIADIIKYSSNTEFRSQCFAALQAENTHDAKDKLCDKLKECINYSKVQKKCIKMSHEGSPPKNLHRKRSRKDTKNEIQKENNGDALLNELDGFEEW